jgi:membrane-associated protease RseP (regulator of RpoE activity)
MLGSPSETPFDLRFRLLGIPVRVHPLFWLVMLMIGGSAGTDRAVVVFVVCAFVSVLVHEMGHGLAARATGYEPLGIVLYAMGGYCTLDPREQSPAQRLFVLLMGPGAGFILLALVLIAARASYGVSPADALSMFTMGEDGDPISFILRRVLRVIGLDGGNFFNAIRRLPPNPIQRMSFVSLLEINFLWGVLNLLPIWPLDGGQSTEVVLKQANPRNARWWTHVVSIVAAGAIAMWWVSRSDFLLALWFGYFALVNYQMLRGIQRTWSHRADDPEWWRS